MKTLEDLLPVIEAATVRDENLYDAYAEFSKTFNPGVVKALVLECLAAREFLKNATWVTDKLHDVRSINYTQARAATDAALYNSLQCFTDEGR